MVNYVRDCLNRIFKALLLQRRLSLTKFSILKIGTTGFLKNYTESLYK